MEILKRTRTRITENFRIDLKASELRDLLNRGEPENSPHYIPRDASITVQVPGRADWSNCSLDIDEHPILIEWTIESGTEHDS